MSKIKYPATMVVRWATGPVNCCDEHGQQLIVLGSFLGSHIVATKLEEPAECTSCVKEKSVHPNTPHPKGEI